MLTLIPGAHRVSPGSLPTIESRPLLLTDIDGTVMAVWQQSFPFDYSAEYQTSAMSIRSRDIQTLFRPDVVHAINAASSELEVKWHRMWGADAANDFSPFVEPVAFSPF